VAKSGPLVSVRMVLGVRGCPECDCAGCRKVWGKVGKDVETVRLPPPLSDRLLFPLSRTARTN